MCSGLDNKKEKGRICFLKRGENPLVKKMTTHFSIFAREIPWTEEPGGATVHGVTKEADTT